MAAARDTAEQDGASGRRRSSGWTASPGAVRGVVALLVLLAIYLIGALSHLHLLGL